VGLLTANFILIRFCWHSIFKLNAPHLRRITAILHIVYFRNFVINDVIKNCQILPTSLNGGQTEPIW